jgi:hypothetical protein
VFVISISVIVSEIYATKQQMDSKKIISEMNPIP